MTEVLEKCLKILEFAPPEEIDNFARRKLSRELYDYQKSIEIKLAKVFYRIDGNDYSSILDAIYELETWDELEIHMVNPNIDVKWEYDTPTKLIKMTPMGKGGLLIYPIDPSALEQWDPGQEPVIEACMVMAYLSHFYSPESIKTHSNKYDEKPVVPPRTLGSPAEMWEDIRTKGIVPFQITLCAYSHTTRYRYQLDAVDSAILMDFRNERIPIANRVLRQPSEYPYLDRLLSTQALPELAEKVLQIFYEVEEAEMADIEIGLDITEKMARDNINALVRRGLLEEIGKPPRAKYVISLSRVREAADEALNNI